MPNSKGLKLEHVEERQRITRVETPGMYSFFPSAEENSGAAVLIMPSGGYHHLTYVLGGFQIAKWLNTLGVNAFVLIYRLPTEEDLVERDKGPVQDAQRAMKLIRANAGEWGVDIDRVGVFGSSAGGHLASTLGTHQEDFSRIGDDMDAIEFAPDLMILVSPVISMGESAHAGSRANLLGPTPSDDKLNYYSNELHVNENTPPAFIVHAQNDKTVICKNSMLLHEAMVNAEISSSLHIFPEGGHSIGLRNNPGDTDMWTDLCEVWLQKMEFVK